MAHFQGSRKFIIVAVDHFSKWAETEVEAMQSITTQQAISFISKNIFTRFRIPKVVIIYNGTQFVSSKFKGFYKKWEIDLRFSSVYHPQTVCFQCENVRDLILKRTYVTSGSAGFGKLDETGKDRLGSRRSFAQDPISWPS